ncbi:MAG TPA: ATP-binding protein [Micropepsaceae bacterium]|nr:ATP-binding protein [Micropepsaceae bacterium]
MEGTGIGLHITHQLVQLMGGRIAFTSEMNVGTTFCVDLPAWTGEVAASRDIRFSNVVDISRTGGATLCSMLTMNIPETAQSAAAMPRGMDARFTNYPARPVNVREFFATVDSLLTEPTRDQHRN